MSLVKEHEITSQTGVRHLQRLRNNCCWCRAQPFDIPPLCHVTSNNTFKGKARAVRKYYFVVQLILRTLTIEVLNKSRVQSSIELENVSRMTLGWGRLLWNTYSKPSSRFDQSCAIKEEEKSFYEAK